MHEEKAGHLKQSDSPRSDAPEEGSVLLSLAQEQRWANQELDQALANLARKVKPVYMEMPESDTDDAQKAQPQSPVVEELIHNYQYTRRQAQLIDALTRSLQI